MDRSHEPMRTVEEARQTERPTLAFTLIEVMIAATVLVVGILGLAAVITYATRQDEVNGEYARALSGARSTVENVKNTAFASILTSWNQDGASQGYTDPATQRQSIGDFTIYRLNPLSTPKVYVHAPYPNGNNINAVGSVFIDGVTSATLYRVKVVVDWDGALRYQHLEMLTMVTDD